MIQLTHVFSSSTVFLHNHVCIGTAWALTNSLASLAFSWMAMSSLISSWDQNNHNPFRPLWFCDRNGTTQSNSQKSWCFTRTSNIFSKEPKELHTFHDSSYFLFCWFCLQWLFDFGSIGKNSLRSIVRIVRISLIRAALRPLLPAMAAASPETRFVNWSVKLNLPSTVKVDDGSYLWRFCWFCLDFVLMLMILVGFCWIESETISKSAWLTQLPMVRKPKGSPVDTSAVGPHLLQGLAGPNDT